MALVCRFHGRSRVLLEQLAAPSCEIGCVCPHEPRDQGPSCNLRVPGERMVSLEAEPSAQQKCPGARHSRSLQLYHRRPKRNPQRRPPGGLYKHELQDDLREHGPWRKRGKDLFRPDTKQVVCKCDSLAREPEIVLPVAGKSGAR